MSRHTDRMFEIEEFRIVSVVWKVSTNFSTVTLWLKLQIFHTGKFLEAA